MLINKQSFFNLVLYYYIVITFLSNISYIIELFPYFEYLKYLSFLLFIIYISSFKVKKVINPQILPFLLLIVSAIVHINSISTQTIFNIIFYSAGLVLFIFNEHIKFPVKKALYLSITMTFLFFISSTNINANFLSLQSLIVPPDDIPASLSYIFGFITIIFLLEKKYKLALLAFIFIIIVPKRLVILSTLLIIFLNFIPTFLSKYVLNKKLLILINITFLIFTIYLTIGVYDDFIITNTGLQPGHLTSGRTSFYSYVMNTSNIFENSNWITGIGEGSVVNILKGNFRGTYLLHNDILKILIEHGVIVLVFFSFMLYRKGNYNQKMISLFYNFLLFFDNTLIYPFAFVFYFMAWNHFSDKNNNSINISK